MGTLRELNSTEKNVHLLTTNSGLAEIYVYDSLKEKCGASLDSVYEVKTQGDFKNMLELVNVQPYLADKWLFVITYSKLKKMCSKFKGVFLSETSVFLVKAKNYKEYKEFKELIPNCNDLYLSIIRKYDVSYLLNGYNLSPKIVEFVGVSYSRDPEKVFTLKKELDIGLEISNQKDVVKLLGSSSGSVNRLVFLLLAEPPKSKLGLNKVLRGRIQLAEELCQTYGYSSVRNFMLSSIRDIYNIKVLYMQGIIFNAIRDLPEIYDEKQLSKYNIYLERITNEIPFDRIARLYVALNSNKWFSELDLVKFMYDYYEDIGIEIEKEA